MKDVFFHDNVTLCELIEKLWPKIIAGTGAHEDQDTLEAIFDRFIFTLINDKDFSEFQEATSEFFHKIRMANRFPEVNDAPLLQQAYFQIEIMDRVSRRLDMHTKLPAAIYAALNGPRAERLKCAFEYAATHESVSTSRIVSHLEKMGTPTTRQHALNILSRLEQLGVISLIKPLKNAASNAPLNYSITALGKKVAEKFNPPLSTATKKRPGLELTIIRPDERSSFLNNLSSETIAPELNGVKLPNGRIAYWSKKYPQYIE